MILKGSKARGSVLPSDQDMLWMNFTQNLRGEAKSCGRLPISAVVIVEWKLGWP